jgi:hypothetical protein
MIILAQPAHDGRAHALVNQKSHLNGLGLREKGSILEGLGCKEKARMLF